jgi:hypothetical protein
MEGLIPTGKGWGDAGLGRVDSLMEISDRELYLVFVGLRFHKRSEVKMGFGSHHVRQMKELEVYPELEASHLQAIEGFPRG